jgi:hypothetical protein
MNTPPGKLMIVFVKEDDTHNSASRELLKRMDMMIKMNKLQRWIDAACLLPTGTYVCPVA